MSDLGLKPREIRKQPDGLSACGRLGSLENSSKLRRCLFFGFFFTACLALLAFGDKVTCLDCVDDTKAMRH
jgi:hypothetical protein